jgi:chitodextrinase
MMPATINWPSRFSGRATLVALGLAILGSACDNLDAFEADPAADPTANAATEAPLTLTAVPASATAVGLIWSTSANPAVTAYRVFRNGAGVATVLGAAHDDTGLSPSTTYSYTVAAVDASGRTSLTSQPATVTTLASGQSDGQAPTAPASLSATALGPTSVALNWSASTDNVGVLGYRIFRNGAQVATASGTTYTDIGLTPSTVYSYAVAAYDAAGNVSSLSPSAVAQTAAPSPGDTQAPTPPSSLTATATGTSTVSVSWGASTDNVGVAGYRIFRNGTQVGTATGTSYNDTGLAPATVYTYTVVAFDAAGNSSSPSSSATATTQSPPDTQAPTMPTSVTATATSFSTIALSWSPSTDNVGVVEYRIFRNGVQVGTSGGTTFNDTGLQPLTTYTYRVAARDAAGNVSTQSAPVSATTLPLVP